MGHRMSDGLFATEIYANWIRKEELEMWFTYLFPSLHQLLDELAENYLKGPEMEYQRSSYNNNENLQGQSHSPVIRKPIAARSKDQGIALMTNGS